MILAVILWMLAHLMHAAVDVGEPVPPPAAFATPAPVLRPPLVAPPAVTPGDRPTTPHYAPPPVEAAPAGEPGCLPGEEWQGEFGCVAVQLDGETIGRAYG